jgi:L-threonylcarbamoyladenylate synthase
MTSWLRIDQAARTILAGGVVAYPTEAVYGIGCLPHNEQGLRRILRLKRRDARRGLIVVAADIGQLENLAQFPDAVSTDRLLPGWPGPVTYVVPAGCSASPLLTGGRATIAVRISDHPIVRRLCLRTGSALVSTSANFSGHPPALSALGVRRTIGPEIDLVLAGPLGNQQKPTEIRDLETGNILRRGQPVT